jgi:hypothetical protein
MSSSSRSRATKSTAPSTVSSKTSKSKKSVTPYDRGFEQHLTDHGIHPEYKSRKPDIGEVREALAVSRASLSPSRFSEGAFEAFQESNNLAKDEEDVRVHIIPSITGPRQTAHPTAMNTLFGNLEPLTDGTLSSAKPDVYFGAQPEDLHRHIRDELAGHIIPSTMEDKPMAPNFFLEAKGPRGDGFVAALQARYDGAVGARAMHTLQNYGEEEPEFDGNAYTYSSTYLDGRLRLYTHHITGPSAPERRPEYHMALLRGFDMMDSRERFLEGATAFRNARDLARSHRDGFIQNANARLHPPDTDGEAPPEEAGPFLEETQLEGLNFDGRVHQNDVAAPQTGGPENSGPTATNEAMARLYDATELEGYNQAPASSGELETPTTLTAVSPQISGTQRIRSKRNRASRSPTSLSQPHKKHGPSKSQTRCSALAPQHAVGDPEQIYIPTAEEAAVDEYQDRHLG